MVNVWNVYHYITTRSTQPNQIVNFNVLSFKCVSSLILVIKLCSSSICLVSESRLKLSNQLQSPFFNVPGFSDFLSDDFFNIFNIVSLRFYLVTDTLIKFIIFFFKVSYLNHHFIDTGKGGKARSALKFNGFSLVVPCTKSGG